MPSSTATKTRDLLREARRDRGISQREAAIAVGVSVATYQRAEGGPGVPHAKIAFRIARYFDLKPSDIWPVTPREEVASNA